MALVQSNLMLFFEGWMFQDIIFIPLLIRLLSMFIFSNVMSRLLTEAEREREVYRGYINGYLAISTALLLALTVANAKSEIHLNDAVFCSVVSFVSFELALSMQTYKFKLFSAQLTDGILDVARLGIYLTVVAVFSSLGLNGFSKIMITLLSIAYFIDFAIKTFHNITILRGYNELKKKGQ